MMMRGAGKPKKTAAAKAKAVKNTPNLDDLLKVRDYTGALALLEFNLKCNDGDARDNLMWIGYAAFHLGNFERVEKAYRELLEQHDMGDEVYLFLACCLFFQQKYEEAEAAAERGPGSALKNRLLFNCAHRGDPSLRGLGSPEPKEHRVVVAASAAVRDLHAEDVRARHHIQ